MDDRPGHHQGKQGRGQTADGHDPEHRDAVAGVDDGRGVGADGVEGRMPHVEHAGMAEDDVEAQAEDHVQADAIEHVQPVTVEKQRRGQKHGEQDDVENTLRVLHIFSATRSPSSPVGRTMRMTISTKKAMASFQAMEI